MISAIINIKHVSKHVKTCQDYLRDFTRLLSCRCEHIDSSPAIPIAQIDASHDQVGLVGGKCRGYDFVQKWKLLPCFLSTIFQISWDRWSNEITIGHCSAVLHSTMCMTAGQHNEHHGQLNMDMFIRSEDCWLQRCFWSEWRPQVATWNLENFRASGCGISRHCRMSQWCGCEPSTQPKKCTSIGWSREVACWLRYLFPASRQFLHSEIFHGMIRVACDGYKRPK